MTQEHPITPSPELVREWESTAYDAAPVSYTHHIARCAARWGADQELEACLELLNSESLFFKRSCWKWLRDRRRPKPPSLKEQAIEILDDIDTQLDAVHYNILRRALETLSD